MAAISLFCTCATRRVLRGVQAARLLRRVELVASVSGAAGAAAAAHPSRSRLACRTDTAVCRGTSIMPTQPGRRDFAVSLGMCQITPGETMDLVPDLSRQPIYGQPAYRRGSRDTRLFYKQRAAVYRGSFEIEANVPLTTETFIDALYGALARSASLALSGELT
jgi:hypothetical protein